jgi:alpha-beta hydrolase superfamily lysophospholipase
MRKLILAIGTVVVLLTALSFWPVSTELGRAEFFSDSSFNFEALRVLNDVAAAGGDSGEALQAISSIKTGDAESWYSSWKAAGDRSLETADHTLDAQNKGNGLLRAHTYYRTAEFFLSPDDPKRAAVYRSSVDAFYKALDVQSVAYQRIVVPYGKYQLNAVYYQGPAGAETRPLLIVVGGYDSTMEELYLGVGAAAHQHGYAVLTYEGPGQGAVLREQHLPMQSDWEKPNGAVLDTFLATHAKPSKLVLLGESLGGYLAPRAAALDHRIDGVVAFDIWYDGYAIATRYIPSFIFWLHEHGHDDLVAKLAQSHSDTGSRWAVANGQWVFGVHGMFSVLDAFKSYRLAPVSERITQDVLLFAGSDDRFVPIDQMDMMRHSLSAARSVAAVTFDRASGGSLHCQMGAPSLWQGVLFDWMDAKFGQRQTAAN